MHVFLIRHAESENNARPLYQRVEDPPITAVGRLQSEHLAGWVKTLKLDLLITSPVLRALQTTRFLTDVTGQHVHVWSDLFEEGGIYRGYGPEATEGGMGLSRSDVIRHVTEDPASCTLDDTIVESGWWGGRKRETSEEAIERAASVEQRLIDRFGSSDQTIALVIHADFKRKLLGAMFDGQVDTRALGRLRNTGISKIDFDGQRWQLDWFNAVSHLPGRLITSQEA